MLDQALLQDSLLGLEFGHYRILERIGSGGMGVVYRGFDSHLDREVAIKLLHPGSVADSNSHRRFLNEAHALSKLNHPNIATVFDFHTHDGRDFLVMEYIEGITLNQKLLDGSLPEKDILSLGTQLAEGLAAAHDHSIIHRDLKPGNLRITPDGRLKILDFGLAKLRFASSSSAASETITESQVVAGTLAYMAPEQVLGGEIDARTDIHAVGTVLYQMSTGTPPFTALERSELMNEVLRSAPDPVSSLNPRLSPELARIIGKCLERDPDNRYQSARELAIDLRRLQSGASSNMVPVPPFSTRRFSLPRKRTWLGAAIVLSALLAFAVWKWVPAVSGGVGTPRINSLAVLPLVNLSGEPQQEYFADGMTEELITNLGKVRSLRVISRTSVMQYKQSKKSLPQIAAELGVDAIVEGSVLRSGNRVRITAKLINSRDDRNLWSENYDRDLSDILSLQNDVARTITSEIRATVTPQEQARLTSARQVDPEAYELTLKAKALLDYATQPQQLRDAVDLFQRAIDRDPTYAPAWAGLGDASWTMAATGFETVAPDSVRDKAIYDADKALALDDNLAEAHKARADIALDGEWDFVRAQKEYQRAVELQPGYAAAHSSFGQLLLSPLSRFADARLEFDRARKLDPVSPWNDINLIAWWRVQGLNDDAIKAAQSAQRNNPNLWAIPWELGTVRLHLGQTEQAIRDFQSALALLSPERPSPLLASLGSAYGLAGRKADALQILDELQTISRNRYVAPSYLASIYVTLGRRDEAFALLDQALRERTPSLAYWTRRDPVCDLLRDDPRWQPFLARLRQQIRLPAGTPDPYG